MDNVRLGCWLNRLIFSIRAGMKILLYLNKLSDIRGFALKFRSAMDNGRQQRQSKTLSKRAVASIPSFPWAALNCASLLANPVVYKLP